MLSGVVLTGHRIVYYEISDLHALFDILGVF